MQLTVTETYESLRGQYGPSVKLHTVRRAVTRLINEHKIKKTVAGATRLLTAGDVKKVIQLLRDKGSIKSSETAAV